MKDILKCILLIDDDETTNTLNTLTIQDMSICHSVLSFTTPEEALDYLSRKPSDIPEVVFIDYYLPASTAIELSTQLKKISDEIKTVTLTAYISYTQSKEIVGSPDIDDLIIKPLTEEKLVVSLKKMGLI